MAARLGSFKGTLGAQLICSYELQRYDACSNAASAAEAGKLLIRWKAPLRRQLVEQAR